jgi:Uncharacterized protein conserved in bacteria (DUF2272)
MRCAVPLALMLALAGCAARGGVVAGPVRRAAQTDAHVPLFAIQPYQPFSRQAAIAIALREWRLFGQPVDDDPPNTRPPPPPEDKPERMPGLWQRVGEYWWIGMEPDAREVAWTGKHDQYGRLFPASIDGDYAWSAAFISYVMRIAAAGPRFPYAAAHSDYIDASFAGAYVLKPFPPESYAPQAGDLICTSRTPRPVRFADLPASRFAAHCAIVVQVAPGMLTVIGGNVDDAVTATHVPTTPSGMLAEPDGTVVDTRYPWFVVLRVLYDIDAEPAEAAPVASAAPSGAAR